MFIVSDILSFIPPSDAGVSPALQIGQKLPAEVQERLAVTESDTGPVMIYVPRHCGCPFPERDLHHLYTILSQNIVMLENAHARIIVLPHAHTPEACQKWFDEVFDAAAASKDNSHYQQIKNLFLVISDPAPSRTIAKALSFGSLSTFGALLSKEGLGEAWRLRKVGIKNRETAAGSNRWTEHGAVWVNGEGLVSYIEKPQAASAECDWVKGWKEVGIQL